MCGKFIEALVGKLRHMINVNMLNVRIVYISVYLDETTKQKENILI